MRERFWRTSGAVFSSMLFLAACKSGGNPVTFGSSSGGGSSAGGGGNAPVYTVSTITGITDESPGLAITLTSNGKKLALGTFAPTGKTNGSTGKVGGGTTTCRIGDGANNPYSGPINTYDIWYAESTDGIQFTATIIDTPAYTNQNTDVGVGLDSTGKATVAWYGGLPTDQPTGALQCGAALWQTAQGSGTTFGVTTVLGDISNSAGTNANQPDNCKTICNDGGEYIGLAPAVAIDSTGQPLFVARDIHFGGSNTTDYAGSDVEFMRGIQGTDSFFTADVARGGGTDSRLAVLPPNDKAVVAYKISPYDLQAPGTPGLWVNTEVDATHWTVSQVVASENLGAGLGFAINTSGRYSLAYYDTSSQYLFYTESTDGVTWSAPEKVDTVGTTGQMPSLAIDPSGEPAIAYYRCNSKVEATSCATDSDGVRVARRVNGAWSLHDVSAQKGYFDGTNPAIAFLNGKEAVVFQTKLFDPGTNTSQVTIQAAMEQ